MESYPRSPGGVTRPESCPFCNGKKIDTLAREFTATTLWRCRVCDQTWTIQSRTPIPPRGR